jgi:hypothetical protein
MCVNSNLSAVLVAVAMVSDDYFLLPCILQLPCSASDEEWRVEQGMQQTDGHPFCDKRISSGLLFRFREVI